MMIATIKGAIVTSVTWDSSTAGVGRYTVTIKVDCPHCRENSGFTGQGKNWADAIEDAFSNAKNYFTELGY